MKKILPFFLTFCCFASLAGAQLNGILKRVKNRVESKVENKADQKIDKAIDHALDGQEVRQTQEASQAVPGEKTTAAEAEATLNSFSKFDFIPGEKILFYNNFEQDQLAELPAGWNTNGTGEVVTFGSYPGKWVRLHNPFVYLANNHAVFPENYTIEFDVILQLKNNGWMYPTLSFGVFASGTEDAGANAFLRDYNKNASVIATIYPAEYNGSRIKTECFAGGAPYFSSETKAAGAIEKYYGKPLHIALQVQKERLRIWLNELKAFDVPRGVPVNATMNQFLVKIGHTNYPEEQYGIYMSNIKIATGVPDNRNELAVKGKFTTRGILFDFQKADIKPESYPVIKDIAALLLENPGMKVRIVGHTSNDGDAKANLELSRQRSQRVKDYLQSNFQIDPALLSSDGKGGAEPIDNATTPEAKASNRRVEFIKA